MIHISNTGDGHLWWDIGAPWRFTFTFAPGVKPLGAAGEIHLSAVEAARGYGVFSAVTRKGRLHAVTGDWFAGKVGARVMLVHNRTGSTIAESWSEDQHASIATTWRSAIRKSLRIWRKAELNIRGLWSE